MPNIEDLQKEIKQIKQRNKKVESDKAWEISGTRRILILLLVYILVVVLCYITDLANPFINAAVASLGFFLSTLIVPMVKRWWLKYFYKNTK